MKLRKSRFGTFGLAAALAFACMTLSTAAFAQVSSAASSTAFGSEHRHKMPPPPSPTPNANCTIIVPENALTAAGLATPYRLTATDPSAGPCNEANPAQSAFVQAAILDPATGAISIYSPLVIDRGTTPAVQPVVPVLPAGAVVAIWFGYDATNLTLQPAYGSSLADSHCVNGLPGSVFTQYAYCNAAAFFAAANGAIQSGKLQVPALGTAKDGRPCPTVRDFFIVDQDQSDNRPTQYLATARGTTAQDTAANRAALPQATPLGNPSDNRLLDVFVDSALGCRAWTAPDLADPGQNVPALALNELQARMYQPTPVALVPLGDPMTEVNGVDSLQKVNLYRMGVDQPVVTAEGDADTARYCRQILRIAPERMALNRAVLTAGPSPDAAAANSLFTFLAQRLVTTYQLLNCATEINQALPLSTTSDATGVTLSASIDWRALRAILQALEPSRASDDIADSEMRSR
jgi:hypothetical protein